MQFEITEDQKTKIDIWLSQQREKTKGGLYGPIGGNISYTFTPTSLGDILVVRNDQTKEEINVTDFDSW